MYSKTLFVLPAFLAGLSIASPHNGPATTSTHIVSSAVAVTVTAPTASSNFSVTAPVPTGTVLPSNDPGVIVPIGTGLYSCFTIPTAAPTAGIPPPVSTSFNVTVSTAFPSSVSGSAISTNASSSVFATPSLSRRQVTLTSSRPAPVTVSSSASIITSVPTFSSEAPTGTFTTPGPIFATPPIYICVPIPSGPTIISSEFPTPTATVIASSAVTTDDINSA